MKTETLAIIGCVTGTIGMLTGLANLWLRWKDRRPSLRVRWRPVGSSVAIRVSNGPQPTTLFRIVVASGVKRKPSRLWLARTYDAAADPSVTHPGPFDFEAWQVEEFALPAGIAAGGVWVDDGRGRRQWARRDKTPEGGAQILHPPMRRG